jgi:hypothetical protein
MVILLWEKRDAYVSHPAGSLTKKFKFSNKIGKYAHELIALPICKWY